MSRPSLPQISTPAYFAIRAAFRGRIPAKVDSPWIVANVPKYQEERSARVLVGQLRMLGLIDEQGGPTDVAKKWRTDDGYSEACDQMLQRCFPSDVVDAVSGSSPPREVLQRLLLHKGLGEQTAINVARLLAVLLDKRPQTPVRRVDVPPEKTRHRKPNARPERADMRSAAVPDFSGPAPRQNQLLVLRYFVGNGRLAEVSVPSDITPVETRRLFRHLEIDLPSKQSEGGAE